MMQGIARMDKLVSQADDYARMLELSLKYYGEFRRPPNRMFLVLPTNIVHWDDTNTTTHLFRLYLMCDNSDTEYWTPGAQPHHVHISNHPGYDLN